MTLKGTGRFTLILWQEKAAGSGRRRESIGLLGRINREASRPTDEPFPRKERSWKCP